MRDVSQQSGLTSSVALSEAAKNLIKNDNEVEISYEQEKSL